MRSCETVIVSESDLSRPETLDGLIFLSFAQTRYPPKNKPKTSKFGGINPNSDSVLNSASR